MIASAMVCEKAGLRSCIADTLTATPICSGHLAASLHAPRMTHSPIGTIRPVSSAIGMNSLGATARVRDAPAQERLSAVTRRSTSETIGWKWTSNCPSASAVLRSSSNWRLDRNSSSIFVWKK